MLNATNRQGFNAWATGLATVVAVGLNLVAIAFSGYIGASVATVVTEASLCAFGWWFVQLKRPDLRLPVIRLSWRILVAGVVMGIVLYPIRGFSILLTVPLGFVVYVVAVFVLRAVDRDEYEMAAEGLLSRLQRNPPTVTIVGEDREA